MSFLMDLQFAIPSWVGRDLMCPRDYYSLIVIAFGDPDSKHLLTHGHRSLVDPKLLSVHCRHCSVGEMELRVFSGDRLKYL